MKDKSSRRGRLENRGEWHHLDFLLPERIDPKERFTEKSVTVLLNFMIRDYIHCNMRHGIFPLRQLMRDIEKKAILAALEVTRGHQKTAARLLGVKENLLSIKIKKHHLKRSLPGLSQKSIE